jgi:hypothetical protein
VPMAAHALLTEFETLSEDGCAAAEITELARRMGAAYLGPGASWAFLRRAARDLLNGRRSRDPEESVRLTAGLEPKHIAVAARGLQEQMIVAVPRAVPAVRGRMPALPSWSPGAVTGTVLASADSDATLTVGADGVTLTVEPGRHPAVRQTTVRYQELAALVRWRDGRHVLVGADGFSLQLDPDEWPQGERVIAGVAAHVAADRVVTLDSEAMPRPGRGRTATSAGQPGPAEAASAAGAAATAGGVSGPAATAAAKAQRKRREARAVNWACRMLGVLILLAGLGIGGTARLYCIYLGLTLVLVAFGYGYQRSRLRSRGRSPR